MAEQQEPTGEFDDPMLSRTPGRDIFGKLDDALYMRVSAYEMVDYTREAHNRGMDLTTYLRLLIRTGHYGKEHMHMLLDRQIDGERTNAGHSLSTQPGAPLPTFLRSASK